ncbi:MAG: hypothetical protein ACI9SP_003696 [Arenicella sp.]
MKNKKAALIAGGVLILIFGIYRIVNVRDMSGDEIHEYAIMQFDSSFLPQYTDWEDRNIKCNREEIFEQKMYKFTSIDLIEYECSNGLVVVYRFNRGFGRSVMLADWHPR